MSIDGRGLVPVLDELTAIQADAIRATAAAHNRDPEELALELRHLLIAQKTPEAITAAPVASARMADHDDTVRTLLPLEETPRSEEHTSELQSRQYLVCR